MYYVMTCEEIYPPTAIDESPEVPGTPWNDGHLISETVVEPLMYTLDPEYPGEMLPMYEIGELLVRDDLLSSLRAAGVDNLQIFRAFIKDPISNVMHQNYHAVNIIGLIAAADMDKSVAVSSGVGPQGDIGFDSLVLDETRPQGALMFRLAEAVNAIVVHEKVRKRIEADGIPGLTFWEPGEWAG